MFLWETASLHPDVELFRRAVGEAVLHRNAAEGLPDAGEFDVGRPGHELSERSERRGEDLGAPTVVDRNDRDPEVALVELIEAPLVMREILGREFRKALRVEPEFRNCLLYTSPSPRD